MEFILPDILAKDLDIIFCGTAVGNKAAERRAYYAGPGNLFYSTLASIQLTSRILKPNEFPELLNYRIGLTDLVKHHSGVDKVLKREYFNTKSFSEKILKYQPKLVCFNGKKAAKEYFNLRSTKQVEYGLQANTIGKTRLYVAPSTSSGGKKYWDERIWQELPELIKLS